MLQLDDVLRWVTTPPLDAVLRCVTTLLVVACSSCTQPHPPSLVVITLDTLRTDHVGAQGDRSSLTPRLDALVLGGLVHEAAYTTMPTTGPAHVSLFTGLYPSQHGATANGVRLDPAHATRELGRILGEHGYTTAAFVSSYPATPTATGLRGFEIYDAPRESLRSGTAVVAAALAWLEVVEQRPVFLWVHLFDPHAPYGNLEAKLANLPIDPRRYGFVAPDVYERPESRRAMARRYAEGVAELDTAVGRLVDGVREALGDRVLFALAADHGESLDEHLAMRGWAYDHGEFLDPESIRIPLILLGPGVSPGRSPGTASIRDLYTTLLLAAGVDDPLAQAEGRRDLRTASSQPRVVGIERRSFDEPAAPAIRAHAAAAARGELAVVVGEDGASTEAAAEDVELIEAARGLASAAAERGHRSTAISEESREALRRLGYLE